jgi:hypothetical protein
LRWVPGRALGAIDIRSDDADQALVLVVEDLLCTI